MVSVGKRIFGYRVITAEPGCANKLVGIFLALGISAEGVNSRGFAISEWEYRRFRAYAGGRVRYAASETRGLFGILKRNRHRSPLLIAIVLGIALNLFLSEIVWDVRVNGNERIEEISVVEALNEVGVGVGSYWGSFDPEHVETALLASTPELAWVQINRRGTVAYVEVAERAPISQNDPPPFVCSNVVADRDCVIESITVESGRALVKSGDVVRKGDILISGVIETENGTLLCRAKGEVRAHATGRAEYSAPRKYEVTEYVRGHTVERGVRVFALRINIFKNYGNLSTDYDIIENEKEFVLFGGHTLPLSLYESYVNLPTSHIREYTDSELPSVASEGLFATLDEELADKDLIKLRTSGGYTDEGYSMYAEYVYSCDVGEEIEISLGDTYD